MPLLRSLAELVAGATINMALLAELFASRWPRQRRVKDPCKVQALPAWQNETCCLWADASRPLKRAGFGHLQFAGPKPAKYRLGDAYCRTRKNWLPVGEVTTYGCAAPVTSDHAPFALRALSRTLPVQSITMLPPDLVALMLPGIFVAVGAPIAAMEASVIRPLRICTLLTYIGAKSPSWSASNRAVGRSDQRRSTPPPARGSRLADRSCAS